MLLHGLGATAALNWFPVFRALAPRFRVVALDHRGHGRGIRSRSPFTLEDAADDVAALADILGIDRFVAVGYSMGGPIAQLSWQRHPDRVAGLVLCATAYRFRLTPPEQILFASLPALEWAARLIPCAFSHPIVSVCAGRYPGRASHTGWARRQLLSHDRRSVVQAAMALGRYEAHPWIGNVDVPSSVVIHRHDQLVPPLRQVALARAIRGATTHVVDGDHFSVVRDPCAYVRALTAAVDDVAGASVPSRLAVAS
jgi:3-oxoadipate enol-lactonase